MQANQEFRIEDLWTVHLEDLPTDEPTVEPEFDFEKCIFQIFHNCKNDVEKTQNLARQGYLASDEVDSYYKLTDFLNTQVETIYTRAFKNIEDAVKYRDYLNKKKRIAEQRRAQLEAKNQQQSPIPQNPQIQAQFSTSASTAATTPTSDNRSRASNRRNVPLLRQLSGRFEHLNFRKLDQSVTLCKSLPHFVVCTYHCYVWYPLLRPLPRQLITQFKREMTELETELMSLDSFKYDFIILHPSESARLPNATEFAQNYQAENARFVVCIDDVRNIRYNLIPLNTVSQVVPREAYLEKSDIGDTLYDAIKKKYPLSGYLCIVEYPPEMYHELERRPRRLLFQFTIDEDFRKKIQTGIKLREERQRRHEDELHRKPTEKSKWKGKEKEHSIPMQSSSPLISSDSKRPDHSQSQFAVSGKPSPSKFERVNVHKKLNMSEPIVLLDNQRLERRTSSSSSEVSHRPKIPTTLPTHNTLSSNYSNSNHPPPPPPPIPALPPPLPNLQTTRTSQTQTQSPSPSPTPRHRMIPALPPPLSKK